eukprot:103312-Pyramimonas_sp.AAC.1
MPGCVQRSYAVQCTSLLQEVPLNHHHAWPRPSWPLEWCTDSPDRGQEDICGRIVPRRLGGGGPSLGVRC